MHQQLTLISSLKATQLLDPDCVPETCFPSLHAFYCRNVTAAASAAYDAEPLSHRRCSVPAFNDVQSPVKSLQFQKYLGENMVLYQYKLKSSFNTKVMSKSRCTEIENKLIN